MGYGLVVVFDEEGGGGVVMISKSPSVKNMGLNVVF